MSFSVYSLVFFFDFFIILSFHWVQASPHLPPLPHYIRLVKLLSLLLQHIHNFNLCHANLVAYWHQARRQMHIIFSEEGDCHHNVVYILKYQGLLCGVGRFSIDEGKGMVAPVAAGVEVM